MANPCTLRLTPTDRKGEIPGFQILSSNTKSITLELVEICLKFLCSGASTTEKILSRGKGGEGGKHSKQLSSLLIISKLLSGISLSLKKHVCD